MTNTIKKNAYRMLILAVMTLLMAVNLSQTAFADDCDNIDDSIKGKSDVEAFQFLKSCAEAGDILAQWHVGVMYHSGKGTLESKKEAVRWKLMAAESGDPYYIHAVGFNYLLGRGGFPEDQIRAYMWFNLAAAQGYEDSRKEMDGMRRGILVDKITSAQIEKAQELSVRCLQQNYKDC